MWVGMRVKRGGQKKKIREGGKNGAGVLDQISNVHGHFLHSSIVEGFNVSQRALVIFSDHVDRNALSAKASTTSDSTQIKHRYYTTGTNAQIRQPSKKKPLDSPVNIVLPVGWKVIVDNQ